ncbi:MAG: DNA polymerase III subunit delta' [Burkholderiaceae bacterium]
MIYPWLSKSWQQTLEQRHRLHHALLITGPAGIGKSAFAQSLAAALLCESPAADGAACGRCSACGWFGQGHHPDFRLLAPASADDGNEDGEGRSGGARAGGRAASKPSREIKIDQVRALERFVEIGGHRGGSKLILIDPAEALNTASANALLKTLEEPAGSTRFLLVCNRPDALPATIRSRCAVLPLAAPAADAGADWLAAETSVPRDQAMRWLAAAGGAPLRARRFADPAEATAHRLILETIAGLPETDAVQAAEALSGIEAAAWLGVLQTWVADLGRVRAGAEPRFHPEHTARLRALAQRAGLERLMRFDASLGKLARAVDHPLNPRLMAEDVLIQLHEALAP